jgi:hypothetical protein
MDDYLVDRLSTSHPSYYVIITGTQPFPDCSGRSQRALLHNLEAKTMMWVQIACFACGWPRGGTAPLFTPAFHIHLSVGWT